MYTQTNSNQSEIILNKMTESFDILDHVHITKVKTHVVGQKVRAKNGYQGIIRAFAPIENTMGVWVEIPLRNGKAMHYGFTINDL
jgi:hypothetical protein